MLLAEVSYERHDVEHVRPEARADREDVERVEVDGVVMTQLPLEMCEVALAHLEIDLVSDNSVWSLRHSVLVHLQLVAQRVELHPRVVDRHVEHVQDAGTTVDVAQEVDAQTSVVVRTADDTRNVGDCKKSQSSTTTVPQPWLAKLTEDLVVVCVLDHAKVRS